jgi:hypothetical protein
VDVPAGGGSLSRNVSQVYSRFITDRSNHASAALAMKKNLMRLPIRVVFPGIF